jgi:CDP-diacylglycerol--serine O-phosphatidyltransferase
MGMTVERRRRRFSSGVWVVPSLITAVALFLGFFAIVHTISSLHSGSSDLLPAVYALILAGIFDNMDGRIARLMKAESEFGVQFDSIADMVSFGVAPAVVVYGFALLHLKEWGWFGAFLFVACAAIRLARFNVATADQPSKKYFKGMSSPVAAGGLVICTVMLQRLFEGVYFSVSVLMLTIFLSLLMVSNIRFRAFKDLDFKRHRIQYFLVIVLAMTSVFAFRVNALFVIFLIYLIFGLSEELVLFRRRRRSDPNVPFLPFGDR